MELGSTGKGQTKCEATQQPQGPSQLQCLPSDCACSVNLVALSQPHSSHLAIRGMEPFFMQTENYGREGQLRVFVGPDGAANKPMMSKYMHKASPHRAGAQWVHKMLASPSHPHPKADLRKQTALEAPKNNESLKQPRFVWLPLCPMLSHTIAHLFSSLRDWNSHSHYLGEKTEVKLHVTRSYMHDLCVDLCFPSTTFVPFLLTPLPLRRPPCHPFSSPGVLPANSMWLLHLEGLRHSASGFLERPGYHPGRMRIWEEGGSRHQPLSSFLFSPLHPPARLKAQLPLGKGQG